MARLIRNPVPTSGEVRIARTRREPALRYLRWGSYFSLGLALAGLSVRTLRAAPAQREQRGSRPFAARMANRGEEAVSELRSRPAVDRVTAGASSLRAELASKVEVAADEAHDSIEEVYGRSYAWLGGLRRRLSPATSGLDAHDGGS